jgi:hypothetical protein
MSHRPAEAEPTDDDVARALRHSLDALAPSERMRQQDLAATRQRRRTRVSAVGLVGAAVAALVIVPIVTTTSSPSPSPSPSSSSLGVVTTDDIYIAVDDGVEAVVISVSGG